MEKDLIATETILAVAEDVARAEKHYPIIGNLLIIGMRQEDNANIKAIFQEVANIVQEKVVGFDLAGPEVNFFCGRKV